MKAAQTLESLGLWGDGDEVWAIEEAFQAVNLEVPVEDAGSWYTVGDLWASAERVDPMVVSDPENWDRFRMALSREAGVDWTVANESAKLIDGRGHNIFTRLITSLREKMKKAA